MIRNSPILRHQKSHFPQDLGSETMSEQANKCGSRIWELVPGHKVIGITLLKKFVGNKTR